MTHITRPFVLSLQSRLQLRLPDDEYRQIMEESQWEFEKLLEDGGNGLSTQSESSARFCSICVSFYRAMVSVGMERRLAADTIADASRELDWSPAPGPAVDACALADYFHAKDALTLCETAFCRKCPRREGCSHLAELKAPRTLPR